MLRLGRLLLLPLGLLAVLLAAAVAQAASPSASKIVYVCDPNLCVVDPITGISSQITSDGASYRDPSLSRDGTRLAAGRGYDVVVGAFGSNPSEIWKSTQGLNDVALSPDGSAVAESHSYVANRYGCPLTGGCLELVDMSGASYSVAPNPADDGKGFKGGGGVGFLGGGLLTSWYTYSSDTHTVCVIAAPLATDPPCAAQIDSVGKFLADPTGTADGSLIATTIGELGGDGTTVAATAINLYSGTTGALVRPLVGSGSEPAFSPDGGEVAYLGADGWIHLISVNGGKDRRLVQGSGPTWSAAPASKLAPLKGTLKLRKGKVKVRLRCTGPTPCSGRIRLRKGKATLGQKRFQLAPGKARAIAVKATKRGRRLIAAAPAQKVTVTIKLDQGKNVTKKLKLKR